MASTLFDITVYTAINEARWAAVERILDQMPGLNTCLDAGCGAGWFSERLAGRGLAVNSFDGRTENVEEARRRISGNFTTADVESVHAMQAMPVVDLVFCFGLLYHLESPFRAIRNLRRCAGSCMLIETQISPSKYPDLRLISESENETQGLRFMAAIPSRAALVKMLYASGFGSVERFTGTVDHEDFVDSRTRIHRREIFLAADKARHLDDFVLEPEPTTPKIDYRRWRFRPWPL